MRWWNPLSSWMEAVPGRYAAAVDHVTLMERLVLLGQTVMN